MMPGQLAQERGYSQILWLYGLEEYVTEVGAMNVFFLFEKSSSNDADDDGNTKKRYELVTPPLTNGDILPGVTRQSIIELISTWNNNNNNTDDEEYDSLDVVERSLSMNEIKQSAIDGRLIEAFGAGTAAVVTPISHIQYRGEDIVIPAPGRLTQRLYNDLVNIQYGIVDGPEGWSVRV
jgi:branched-chain amino acid aminotransferase